MIGHRDGIVGAWRTVPAGGSAYGELPLESVANSLENLRRWEPWVRANVFDFESQSPLQFKMAGTEAQLHLYDNTGGASGKLTGMLRPTKAIFEQQLDLVAGYADLREDRRSEILAQTIPQIAFWSSVVNLNPWRAKWTLELIDVALRLANHVEMRFKHALASLRPHELSPQIQPMIQTPGHSAYPSGHGTEAHLIAYLLCELVPPQTTINMLREQLMRQAARIAINRTVAGVHFPVDSAAGQHLGLLLGQYLVARSVGGRVIKTYAFDGTLFGPNDDFEFRKLYDATTGTYPAGLPAYMVAGADITPGKSPTLEWLWKEAKAEWR
jgi:hypothetical protein